MISEERFVHEVVPLVEKLSRSYFRAGEDGKQEVLLSLWWRRGIYDPARGVPLEHWVNWIAKRQFLTVLRNQGRKEARAVPHDVGILGPYVAPPSPEEHYFGLEIGELWEKSLPQQLRGLRHAIAGTGG